jgi:hypothetical protein
VIYCLKHLTRKIKMIINHLPQFKNRYPKLNAYSVTYPNKPIPVNACDEKRHKQLIRSTKRLLGKTIELITIHVDTPYVLIRDPIGWIDLPAGETIITEYNDDIFTLEEDSRIYYSIFYLKILYSHLPEDRLTQIAEEAAKRWDDIDVERWRRHYLDATAPPLTAELR